jgi:hypothetical protein
VRNERREREQERTKSESEAKKLKEIDRKEEERICNKTKRKIY